MHLTWQTVYSHSCKQETAVYRSLHASIIHSTTFHARKSQVKEQKPQKTKKTHSLRVGLQRLQLDQERTNSLSSWAVQTTIATAFSKLQGSEKRSRLGKENQVNVTRVFSDLTCCLQLSCPIAWITYAKRTQCHQRDETPWHLTVILGRGALASPTSQPCFTPLDHAAAPPNNNVGPVIFMLSVQWCPEATGVSDCVDATLT